MRHFILLAILVALPAPTAAANETALFCDTFDNGFWHGKDGWTAADQDGASGLSTWDDDYDAAARAWSGRALHCADLKGGVGSGTAQKYENDMRAVLERKIDLSAVPKGDRVLVRFRLWRALEANYDFFRVQVSLDGVNYLTRLSLTGSDPYWRFHEVDISNLAGQSAVRVALVVETDSSVTAEGVYLDQFEIVRSNVVVALVDRRVYSPADGQPRLVYHGSEAAYCAFRVVNGSSIPVRLWMKVRIRRWQGDLLVQDVTDWVRKPSSGDYLFQPGETKGFALADLGPAGAGVYSFDVVVYDDLGVVQTSSYSYGWSMQNHTYPGRYYRTYGLPATTSNDYFADDVWHHPSDEDILFAAATAIDSTIALDPAAARLALQKFVTGAIDYRTTDTPDCVQHDVCNPGDFTSDLDNLHGFHRKADGKILGDCNDYASLYIGLARAMRLPSRFLVVDFFQGPGDVTIQGYGAGWKLNGAHAAAETDAGAGWKSVDPTWNFVDSDLSWFQSGYATNGGTKAGHVAVVRQKSKAALDDIDAFRWNSTYTLLIPSCTTWYDGTWKYDPSPTPWAAAE